MPERLPDREMFRVCFGPAFLIEPPHKPVALLVWQPSCIVRPIRKKKERRHSQNDGRGSFEQKEPAPSGKAQPANSKDGSGNRATKHVSDGNGRHEPRNRFCPILIG